MSPAIATAEDASADVVRAIVAQALKIDPQACDPDRPLTAYGLDSMTAVQLVADLEDALGRPLPEWLLLEHATLGALSAALCGSGPDAHSELAMMRADSVLPADVWPAQSEPRRSGRHVLLTGATGFLGASLLRTLLEAPEVRVTCLVRGSGGDLLARVRQNLDAYGLWDSRFASRVEAIAGDLSAPGLGLDRDRYAALAATTDVVYHAGADVNWVRSYSALRDANVIGTLELLRLAAAGPPKPFHFVSSLSVCYATNGPATIDEDEDMLPRVEDLPLGYAQTKCVAESLVRQAHARGLPTRIYRPALLAGDGRTGASNPDDLVAILLSGCVRMGVAPDLDWVFDALPVDYAARAIVDLSKSHDTTPHTIHLKHPRPRHWRECVLWANFFGYRMRLERYGLWRRRLERDDVDAGLPLQRLRAFFVRPVAGQRTAAELYEEHVRSSLVDFRSREALARLDVPCPALSATLLDRYFQDYIRRGVLPQPRSGGAGRCREVRRSARRRGQVPGAGRSPIDTLEPILQAALRTHFEDAHLEIRRIERMAEGSDRSIISELMSWRHGSDIGLSRVRVTISGQSVPRSLDLMIKTKTSDQHVLDAGETLADVCDESVARELRRFRDFIGVRESHRRELAIYDSAEARLAHHMPTCYGTWQSGGRWGLALEHLQGMTVLDASDDLSAWTPRHIAAAIDGLATIHGLWLGRERELCKQPWIGHVATAASAARMTPLWRALSAHAAPRVAHWAGPGLAATHQQLAETVEQWWPALERSPWTMLHNDFNSRNIGLRDTPEGPRLVAYDWELATVGAPQRDLAELLCFVLPDDAGIDVLGGWVDRHRRQLQHASGRLLPPEAWWLGFESALAELLINRLAFYALIDRVKPQLFLPRVLRSWHRLYDLTAIAIHEGLAS